MSLGPQGKGPNADQSDCQPCNGDNHSSFGVCIPCPLGLIVDDDKGGCSPCGVHRTAVSTGKNSQSSCGCQDEYFNSTKKNIVCFHGSYDPDYYSRLIQSQEDSAASTGQSCTTCPADITGDECVICRDGADPVVSAGFTIPQMDSADGRGRSFDGVPLPQQDGAG